MRIWPLLVAAPLLMGATADPRPGLVELQMTGDYALALQQVEQFLTQDPTRAETWGFEYLRGHLLEQVQRSAEAPAAFQAALDSAPLLTDYGNYRLARNQYESGRPESAAEVLGVLLAKDPPAILLPVTIRLMGRSLADGGDCTLLDSWQKWGLDAAQTRQIQIALVDCALEADKIDHARSIMVALLSHSQKDEPAIEAAERLATLFPNDLDPQTQLLVGLSLYHHRSFDRAIVFLESSFEDPGSSSRGVRQVDEIDILYALARSYYWQGDYATAAERFSIVADQDSDPKETARALFQRGRSLALDGDWDRAIDSYRGVANADPYGSWAGAAQVSTLRLEWRQGREETALVILQHLRSRSGWRSSTERAALFLAASNLVRGRTDGVEAWLNLARQAHRRDNPDIWYWRGRLAELQNRPEDALDHYLSLMAINIYHPLAQIAQSRLQKGELQEAARERAERLVNSDRTHDLLHAWLLLSATHPIQPELREHLLDRWKQSGRTRPFLEMQPTAPGQWNIWAQRVRRPEDLLLTLGIVEAMSSSVRSAFPLDNNNLALAGSELLTSAGLHKRSLYSAEVISRRIPRGLPHAFLPDTFRRLLYPRPYEPIVAHQASRFGVDPDLLTAIIREESRFDPMAISPAAARGLNQFILPTAQRLARKLGLGDLHTSDLHDPDIAITLGAAYLAELERFFGGNTLQVIAAYNAGEDLAHLWLSYCFSQEPDEYFTKVGYRQTRNYLEKVLTSRAQYREIDSRQVE